MPLPVGGRCRLELYVSVACQPRVSGTEYWLFLADIPATGVDATRFASASSGLASTRSICGLVGGTARPKIRLNAPQIPDCAFTVNAASMRVRNGLNRAVSLIMSP